MEEKYKNKISWDAECEEFTVLYPNETGLPVSIYLDDGYAAKTFSHPVVLFVQNSYNHLDRTYRHLICLTANERVENVFNTELRIRFEDYAKVRYWVFNHIDLIRDLSNREIDIVEFLKEYRNSQGHKKRFVAENVDTDSQHMINEMAILNGSLFGLPYAIWIDNTQTWRTSGHSPRIKIQSTNRSKNTRTWNPFILSDIEFAEVNNDIKKYSAKDIKTIKKFVTANLDFIKEVTCGNKEYDTDDVISGILTMEEINANKTKESINKNLKKLIYMQTLKSSSDSYIIVQDTENEKYSLVSERTGDNVLNDQWFDAIIPVIKVIDNIECITVFNEEKISYIKINK